MQNDAKDGKPAAKDKGKTRLTAAGWVLVLVWIALMGCMVASLIAAPKEFGVTGLLMTIVYTVFALAELVGNPIMTKRGENGKAARGKGERKP